MKRLFLVIGLLAVSACVGMLEPAEPPSQLNSAAAEARNRADSAAAAAAYRASLPAHPDPLCYYEPPYTLGGPPGEVCA